MKGFQFRALDALLPSRRFRFLRRRALERIDHRDRRGAHHAARLSRVAAGRAEQLGHRRLHAAIRRRQRGDGGRARDHAVGVL